MESSARERFIREYFGDNQPLSEAEIDQLASALYKLATEGAPIPKPLLRHSYTGDLNTSRHCGHTLDAIPAALDRLGPDRETVVVALISRFEQAVKDHHDYVNNRKPEAPLDREIQQRYFDLCYLFVAVKPKTEKSVIQVADFLRSDKWEVHEQASEMLNGAPYFPIIIDRLFENVANYSIRRWPNQQSRTLASFAHIPEVRLRLMNCFHSQEENLRSLAVMAFPFLKEQAGLDAEEELFAIAANDADKLQGEALIALHTIAPHSAKLRQIALRLVCSEKYWVRGNAITCLEAFKDRESIDALLGALLDEGGADFDNPSNAAKLLEKMPLDPEHVLKPLLDIFQTLLQREDTRYEGLPELGADGKSAANSFKFTVEVRGESVEDPFRYANPETLLAVARIFGSLGAAACQAIPLIENCLARPYVAGASDGEEWQKILEAITNPGAKWDSAR